MPTEIDIDEEIAHDILTQELKNAPKNVKDAYALEEYCKKNIDNEGKESMRFSLWSIFNIFKKTKAVASIHPLNYDVVASPIQQNMLKPSASGNTLQTPLLENVENSSSV